MPTLKNLLAGVTALPGSIEGQLPAGAPKISQVLASVTSALPDTPDLPIPAMPAPQAMMAPPSQVQDIIKGIEGSLPAGLPKFGDITAGGGVPALGGLGGFRPLTAPTGLAPRALSTGSLLGSGFRSI